MYHINLEKHKSVYNYNTFKNLATGEVQLLGFWSDEARQEALYNQS